MCQQKKLCSSSCRFQTMFSTTLLWTAEDHKLLLVSFPKMHFSVIEHTYKWFDPKRTLPNQPGNEQCHLIYHVQDKSLYNYCLIYWMDRARKGIVTKMLLPIIVLFLALFAEKSKSEFCVCTENYSKYFFHLYTTI